MQSGKSNAVSTGSAQRRRPEAGGVAGITLARSTEDAEGCKVFVPRVVPSVWFVWRKREDSRSCSCARPCAVCSTPTMVMGGCAAFLSFVILLHMWSKLLR